MDCYYDGSFTTDPQKAAFGVLLYNPSGQVVDGTVGSLFCFASLVAEARALLEATLLPKRFGIHCRFLSNCKFLVDAINGLKHRWLWQCFDHLGSIQSARLSSSGMSFHFISLARNSKADWVARSARSGSLLPGWVISMM
ncbi:hypothetical protein LINGRAPRIM_LOCUS716 [Linum grandiflorum]